jgi:hypothetical protein
LFEAEEERSMQKLSVGAVRAAVVGAAVRAVLFYFDVDAVLSVRPELITPYTSVHAVRESLFFVDTNRNPYDGDVFHQPPLILLIFHWIRSPLAVHLFFIAVDIAIALCLHDVCALHLQHEETEHETDKLSHTALLTTKAPVQFASDKALRERRQQIQAESAVVRSPLFARQSLPTAIVMVYMLNP